MAIPDIQDLFSDDPPTARLASYFEELYEYLLEQGVPEECLPSPWHVLRRVTRAIDHELIREWLDAYSAVEGEIDDDDDDEGFDEEPRGRHRPPAKRPRPSYLRALDNDDVEEDDGEEVATEEGS